MKKFFCLILIFVAPFFISSVSSADESAALNEVEEDKSLRERVERLEERLEAVEVKGEPGHRLHPVHSLYGLRISGGFTFTVQGVMNVEDKKKAEAAISADMALEGPVGKAGRAVLVLDFQRGAGLEGVGFATAPNGNTTGPNGDIEAFNDTNVHVTQVYYEHVFFDGALTVSLGQLDITEYFDTNEFANDERGRFMANAFVNNPAVEFGGSEDFYSPGVRLTWSPSVAVDVTIGAFEGDGDYKGAFDSPFLMAEIGLHREFLGREGNYRLYYWLRKERPDSSQADLADPTDPGLLRAENKGAGMSVDQSITETLGFWLRWGLQREKVAQFKGFVGGGLNARGGFMGRPDDVMGLGYGLSFIGEDFKRAAPSGFNPGDEHYLEVFYNFSLMGALEGRGFHVTPDLQYVMNPGGDRAAADQFIYALRLQAYF
ncbi:MAG: carbohydrate porin [Thermodesulfobacteriota bacterium]